MKKSIPFNRWVAVSCCGLMPIAGYGIYEVFVQEDPTKNNFSLTTLDGLKEELVEVMETSTDKQESNETKDEVATKPTNGEAAKIEQAQSQETKQTKESEKTSVASTVTTSEESLDQHDAGYLNGISYWSVGKRYKSHLLLVPIEHSAWKAKAEKMAKIAEQRPNQKLFNYWMDDISSEQLKNNPEWVARWCRHSLAYTGIGSWLMASTKQEYWNLVWDACGREDKDKPRDW